MRTEIFISRSISEEEAVLMRIAIQVSSFYRHLCIVWTVFVLLYIPVDIFDVLFLVLI